MNFECPYCTDEFERQDARYQYLSRVFGRDVTMYAFYCRRCRENFACEAQEVQS